MPTLIGPIQEMEALAKSCKINVSGAKIIDVGTEHAAAAEGVRLCRTREPKALLEGSLHTDLLASDDPKARQAIELFVYRIATHLGGF